MNGQCVCNGVCTGADLDVFILPSPTTNAAVGATVTFEVVITNVGSLTASDVSIVAEIPVFLRYKSVSGGECVKGDKTSDKQRINYTCTLKSDDLAATKSSSIKIKAKADSAQTGLFRTTVSTTASETQIGNNVDEVTYTVTGK